MKFKCDRCGGEFESEWTNDEALEEARKNFGAALVDNVKNSVLCDECYELIMHCLKRKNELQ